MLNYLHGVFSGCNIFWFILGFMGIIFLVNLFDAIFYIKGEKKQKKIIIRDKRNNLFIYCFFILMLSTFCKKSIETTVGVVSLLIMFDISLNYIIFKIVDVINFKSKKDLSFYENISKKIILPSEKVVSSIKVKPIEEKKLENVLNVSHIKGIINKLNCFPLSALEKKQVNELSVSIKKYEEGTDDFNIKSEINDGLNALLKIMARYSV